MTREAEYTESAARDRLIEGLPVQARRADVDGIETYIAEGGDGPPLVLLHGGIEGGGAYWAPVIPRLALSHRLVVPDVPGLGESDPTTTRLDETAFASWFSELLRVTCNEPPIVVSHSLVGALAARFASARDAGLRRLVLYGCPAVGPYRLPPGLVVAAIRSDLRPTQHNLDRFTRWPFLDVDRTRRSDPEWYGAFFAYLLARSRVPHIKRTMRHLIRTCTRQIPDAELRRIATPTTLLWGRHDRMVRLRVGESASGRFGWPLHVIDDAGHVPHMERPDEFLAALLRSG
jgi:2-hydroxymuconate-semialdehyde hydrolase